MASSLGARKWPVLQKEYVGEFLKLNCTKITSVRDETSFRDYFTFECTRRRVPGEAAMYSRLQRAFTNAASFQRTLRHVRESSSILWGAWAAIFEAVFKKHPFTVKELQELIEQLNDLNVSLPALSYPPLSLQASTVLHEHLQIIWTTYLDSCLFIIRSLTSDSDSRITPRQYIKGSANVMSIAKTLYEMAQVSDPSGSMLQVGYPEMPAILDYTRKSQEDKRAEWIFCAMLGKGGDGTVTVQRETVSKEKMTFAQKEIQYTRAFNDEAERLQRAKREKSVKNEVEIMQKLRRHRHITTICFYLKEANSLKIMMLPVADMDLKQYMHQVVKDWYPNRERGLLLQWIGCLLDALAFAHGQKIRHKDIKPQNILVHDGKVYLTDFGLSVDFANSERSYTSNTQCGTRKYKAKDHGRHGIEDDIFSLGCVFSEILTVYSGNPLSELEGKLLKDGHTYSGNLESVNKWLHQLVSNPKVDVLVPIVLWMLEENPKDRISAAGITSRNEFKDAGLSCNCGGRRMQRPIADGQQAAFR